MFKYAENLPELPIKFDILQNGKKKRQNSTYKPALCGAYPFGSKLTFVLEVPRILGAFNVILRIAHDEGACFDLPLEYRGHGESYDSDIYSICLNEKNLPAPPKNASAKGLYFYEFLFLRGENTLFSNTENNSELSLALKNAKRFCLMFFDKNYKTPKWFYGGVMAHIFVDRFFRGHGKVELHKGAKLHADWDNEIPDFEYSNDKVANIDFFGGNLWGVCEKIDYLASLGVTILYLSPIFTARSNHRYDTGDYENVDSLLGGNEAFEKLIQTAHKHGMKVILDGVFNHTGDDSRYFNKYGTYQELGAYQSENSPYAKWFNFSNFPNKYECWWNIPTLPRCNQNEQECRDYFCKKIARKWMKMGADGWRLDVADELNNAFLDEFRQNVKEETNGNGIILGEVWENATKKIAYSERRRYFGGKQLDSVMNYPFRNAILSLFLEKDAKKCVDIFKEIASTYPQMSQNCLMNLLGTHDTERILTLLGDMGEGKGLSRLELSKKRLTKEQREKATHLLKMASALQFTFIGVPSIFYGDEVGIEGYHDPFCRMPFPWGKEDKKLLSHYQLLGSFRAKHKCFVDGKICFGECGKDYLSYMRKKGKDCVYVFVNIGKENKTFSVPSNKKIAVCVGDFCYQGKTLTLKENSLVILE